AAATSAAPHQGRATRTPPPTRAARAGAAASASVVPTAHLTSAPAGGVFVVGDSLALGSAPYLHTVFTPAAVEQDLREGRGTAEGARVVAAHGGDGVIVASLGTNDDPRTQIFRPAAEALVAAARGRCLVWATVARPGDVDGVRWSNVNAIIREEAAAHPNVVVVDWAAEQSAHPSWVEGDDVHLTDAGYQARAAALASGVTRCS
ncbi:MAG TPA: GDSL-type esterase/lipase family protein, partial [Mycobacteriales bacterium]|nr:GDSL-type esterase/lipase family protein [Mycobacteriales bacterium]